VANNPEKKKPLFLVVVVLIGVVGRAILYKGAYGVDYFRGPHLKLEGYLAIFPMNLRLSSKVEIFFSFSKPINRIFLEKTR